MPLPALTDKKPHTLPENEGLCKPALSVCLVFLCSSQEIYKNALVVPDVQESFSCAPPKCLCVGVLAFKRGFLVVFICLFDNVYDQITAKSLCNVSLTTHKNKVATLVAGRQFQ